MRLLIVDDDSIVRRLLYAALTAAGHQVEQAGDGTAAWELLRQQPIRLVITDWMMPSMDGGELIRRIRAVSNAPYTFVILLTTKSEKDDVVNGLESGADDYLIKPFHPDELRARVRIGERIVALETRLQGQLALTNAITSSLGEGLYTLDLDEHLTFMNPAAERMLGWTAAEKEGVSIYDTIHDRPAVASPMPATDGVLANSESSALVGVEQAFRRSDGSIFPVECTSTPVILHNQVTGTVVTFHDITTRKQVEQHLALLADYDLLTGLPNRRMFGRLLLQELDKSRREALTLALLFIDLDDFKSVNDSLGHGIGDLLLQTIAVRLTECIYPGDSIARLAGDEFVVLLPNIKSVTFAVTVAERILVALASPCLLASHTVTIGSSIGIGIFPDHATTGEALLRCADIAMYAAKHLGKQRCAVFDQSQIRTSGQGNG